MPSRKLYMYFKNANGSTVALSLDDPREDLTALEVSDAMDAMISEGILKSKTGIITSAQSAKIVEQTVTELEI